MNLQASLFVYGCPTPCVPTTTCGSRWFVATASMLVWRMGLSWVLCVQMGMGAVGVWYAMVVDWICRIICFVARFVSGAWKKNAVKKAA